MNIKIPWIKPTLHGREKQYLLEAVNSTWISGGPFVEKFEREFIRYLKAPFGVSTSNGTTALQLALMVLGLKKGDEVIVPGFTFVAPVNMVLGTGLKPVYADIDPATWCIDPQEIEKKITKKTKAILPVHVYGNVCDMGVILRIARKHGLAVIEDTAEAAFSRYRGQYAGTFGSLACFSFHATKTIAMGEGGFVLTKNKKLYKKMRVIRDHGMRKGKRYWHDEVGYNFRLTNLQAAVGCGQLENLRSILAQRKSMYRTYKKILANESGLDLQVFKPEVDPVVWAVAIKIDPRAFKGNRDSLIRSLLAKGIESRPGFYPFRLMPPYQKVPRLKNAEEVSKNVMSLPSYSALTTKQIHYICQQFLRFKR